MEFRELSEKEFGEFAKSCPVKNFMQSVEMWRRYEGTGREASLLGVTSGKKVVAAALVMCAGKSHGQKVFNAPRGILMDYWAAEAEEILRIFTEGARKFLKKKRGMTLEISPNVVAVSRDTNGKKVAGEDNRWMVETLRRIGYKYLGEYGHAKWTYILETGG